MLVKKIEAAKMVGVSKATFYNHIKSKNISISDNGKVDISELQRVYGHDNVKTLEQREQEKSNNDNTKRTSESVLKDKIIQLEKELEKEKQERQRERELLTGQVDNLNENLKDSLNQNKELTRAITDQRSEAEKRAESVKILSSTYHCSNPCTLARERSLLPLILVKELGEEKKPPVPSGPF